MKKYHIGILLFWILASGIILSSCNKYDDPDPGKSKLLILKIDYDNPVFEGGIEKVLDRPSQAGNIMPLQGDFTGVGDFGFQFYSYIPTGDTVFYGGVFWMGLGKITTPKTFDPPSSFKSELFAAPLPTSLDEIKEAEVYNDVKDSILPTIWPKIGTLTTVKYYMDHKAHVALYLYAPTVGDFDPKVAKWIVFMYLR